MTPRLRDEDRLAVDLLLDRAAGSDGNGHAAFTPFHGAGSEPVARVQSLLRVLDLMPADDPSADLLDRTVRRIEDESAARDPSVLRPAQPAPGVHMPHA
jgi:hypothetical protein